MCGRIRRLEGKADVRGWRTVGGDEELLCHGGGEDKVPTNS